MDDLKRDEIVLANEFRPGALVAGDRPYLGNLVAGAIEGGETALEAAVREMQEEAGLALSDPILIHSGAYVSSGGTGGVHGNAAEHEDILTVVLPARVFVERVRSGDINDLKTLVAGYWFAERHARDRF